MVWARMLAYITGTVDQELLLRNEYLAAENHILKAQIKGRLLLSDGERASLAEIAYRLGRKALEEVALVAKPETILGWYRKFVAKKFDGSKSRLHPGRPRVEREIESLIARMAKESGSVGESGLPAVRPDGGQHSASPWRSSSTPPQTHGQLERLHSNPPGGSGGNRLLHSGSPHVEGPDHILRAVLHSPGEPAGMFIRNHAASGSGVDGTAGPDRDIGGVGLSAQAQISIA
jgi:hypothetical protein